MCRYFRKENPMKSLACTFVCLLLATSVAQAQGVGSSGEITGTVTDSAGAVLPKVTVDVVDTQTGGERTGGARGAGHEPGGGRSPPPHRGRAALARLAAPPLTHR